MTAENKLIARRLGWTQRRDRLWKPSKGPLHEALPDFRTSNEWGGVILEKLMNEYKVTLWSAPAHGKGFVAGNILSEPLSGSFSGKDWRSAVVDAALEVIKREAT